MALDAVVGSPTGNSYITVVTATALLDERLYTQPWYATPQDVTLQAQREAALITATRLIDEEVLWLGERATTTQALDWPRTGLNLDPLTIPLPIQRATAYYALALLRDTSESSTSTSVATGTVKRRRLGETEVEYFQPGTTTVTTTRPAMTSIPAEIRQLLRPFGRIAGGVNVPLVRT